ncbi:MAG: AI-2E family transporter [Oscillospiraceae bacterium]|nr:AI-2E family transporter [Oscillospiraceae bacterium]
MKIKRDPKYFLWGATILIIFVIGILLWAVFNNMPGFAGVCRKLFGIISPIVYGLVFAYVLNPIMVFVEPYLQKWLRKCKMKENGVRKLSRALSVTVSMIIGIGVIYGFFALMLPSLIDSITGIISNMPVYYENTTRWLQELVDKNPEYRPLFDTFYEKIFDGLETWVETALLGNLESLIVNVTTQVFAVLKVVLNLLIGLVAAVYMLVSKEKFMAQTKKIIVAVMKRSRADRLFEVCSHSNRMFSGFISGKIIDSLIIGVLCYIGCSILRMPYTLLVSTIVGITNVIPFFGPFIGAIPSALLILIVDPMKALYFIIFIFALQQLDGNVIGPRILGDAVGLPSFWILVSITVFGGIFGFVGMLLGVPVFAIIYMLVREFVEGKLKAKGAPVATSYYYHMSRTNDLEINGEEKNADAKPAEPEITEEELKQAEKDFWK